MEKNIKRMINILKLDNNYSIPIYNYKKLVGFLKPITYHDIGDDKIIENLMNWRNKNIHAYLSNEKADFEGTRRWLTKFILDNDTKILFILYTNNNYQVGHMGLADGLKTNVNIEMDNIVRGIEYGEQGLMTLALYDLISWVFLSSECCKVYLRVFSDNYRAIKMYENLNFVEKDKYSLVKTTNHDITYYVISKEKLKSEKYFSYMELKRNDHFNNFNHVKNWESK